VIRYLIFYLTLFSSATALAELPVVGNIPVTVTLSGKEGGLIKTDTPWSSDSTKGTITILFYIDPDERDINNKLEEKLEALHIPSSKLQSLVIINYEATWTPNFILDAALKNSQEDFPDAVYVADYDSVLVKKWGLPDSSYTVILFNSKGKVVYRKDTELSCREIDKFIELLFRQMQELLPDNYKSACPKDKDEKSK